ncbi:MAG: dTDP-4-dehydrorhamnose 3,5-epimerase [Pirellulales bacterium]
MAAFSKPPSEVVVIEPRMWLDERGGFQETWRQDRYQALGIPGTFVQDNLAWSHAGVLRGLHFQMPQGQGKLVYVLQGEIFDVCVDVRGDSPTFGQWYGLQLSQANRRQVFVAEGFAHGYLVVSGPALVAYKCTALYAPNYERVIAWDDPALEIAWPEPPRLVSSRDRQARPLREMDLQHLPTLKPVSPT